MAAARTQEVAVEGTTTVECSDGAPAKVFLLGTELSTPRGVHTLARSAAIPFATQTETETIIPVLYLQTFHFRMTKKM